jgi:tRNA U34 5-methylaminomethyl-2-thiouridine-forming methyltransferase MnmC
MERHLVETEDGSHTLYVPALEEQFHSRHGALQESRHVFLETGLRLMAAEKSSIRILEMGFGTGLNAILTAVAADEWNLQIDYTAVEAYPLSAEEISNLNYANLIGGEKTQESWTRIHQATWGIKTAIQSNFSLQKLEARFETLVLAGRVDLIYFDAFAPEKQPELWTEEMFGRMFRFLEPGGMLVTYCSKGAVRRAMMAAGFQVQKVPGPPGKREILRATKPI